MEEGSLIGEGPKEENALPSRPLIEKITDRKTAEAVFSGGRKVITNCCILYARPNGSEKIRYSIRIRKKFGRAVERNRAKRLLRASLQRLAGSFSGHDLILFPRKNMRNSGFWQILRELEQIFSDTSILR
ncbi:MAG: ribonuclease P protein component [Nitrospiria bacterium]